MPIGKNDVCRGVNGMPEDEISDCNTCFAVRKDSG